MNTEFKSGIDDMINKFLQQVEETEDRLLSELQKIRSIKESLKADSNRTSFLLNQPNPKIVSENPESGVLEHATGTELFMWGLNKIGNEATVDQVYMEVSKLSIPAIQERVANNTLRQLLLVSANTLCKKNSLKNDGRKRGAIFSKI